MTETVRNVVLKAFYAVAIPIARALIRSGVGFKEFSEYSKAAFVGVAADEYGFRGRPTNISRISAMTGIGRKQVKRIREFGSDLSLLSCRLVPPSEVLHMWFTDPDFLDDDGMPMDLVIQGAGLSFSSLVARAAGDIPPGAMKKELLRVGAVKETSLGRLKALSRSYVPPSLSDRFESGLRFGFRQLAEIVAKHADNHDLESFQHYIDMDVGDRDLTEVREVFYNSLEALGNDLDDLLASHEAAEINSDQSVGVGLFYFEVEET